MDFPHTKRYFVCPKCNKPVMEIDRLIEYSGTTCLLCNAEIERELANTEHHYFQVFIREIPSLIRRIEALEARHG